MAFDYAPLASTATKMITEFGQAVTFTRNGNVTYDPTQGVSSSSQTTYDANIVLFAQIKSEEVDNSLSFKDFPAVAYSSTPPKIGDTATINGENYRVIEITPVQPATTVIYYELRLRS
jgi:hypothetical protein